MGRFDALTQIEKKPVKDTPPLEAPPQDLLLVKKFASKLVNQQTSKETNQQTSKSESFQTSKETKKLASLLENQQATKPARQETTKEKKKYGTYLREESISAIQMRAIQTKQKDHEVLQEIVDLYFSGKA